MRRFLIKALVVVVLLAAIVIAGGALPEGNPLHDATDWIRRIARRFADGFGGGYTAT